MFFIIKKFLAVIAVVYHHFFLATLHCTQDLSSLIRIELLTPAVGVQSLNHWTAREVPISSFLRGVLNFKLYY